MNNFKKSAFPFGQEALAAAFVAGALVPVFGANVAATALENSKPNVLFIMIDDLGWTDLSCTGSTFYETPNIDKLRSQGMLFTQAYGTSPVCSPARAALMTGRQQHRYGLTDVFMANAYDRYTKCITTAPNPNLPQEEITLGKLFKKAGYRTALIGKWHIGAAKGSKPQDHGFDFVVPETKAMGVQGDWRALNKYTDAAIEFITQNKGKPFYAHIGHTVVHLPYEAPPELIEKYSKKVKPGDAQQFPIYAATIELLDNKIGELMQKLDELGVADNTIVVFTSDNGGRNSNYDWQLVTSNDPLKMGKHTLYEGGIRVPQFVRWPGKIAANTTCETPMTAMDFFPTFARLIGEDIKQFNRDYDGNDIAALFVGGTIPARNLFWYYPHYNHGPTFGKSTAVMKMRPASVVRKGDYKLVEWLEEPNAVELYDLSKDIGEKTNLAYTQPGKVAELRALLKQWYADTGVKLPEIRKPYNGGLFGLPLSTIEGLRKEGEDRLRKELGLPVQDDGKNTATTQQVPEPLAPLALAD